MQNNQLSAVKVNTSKRPRARFNMSYDVNTTSEWGFLQPFAGKFMIPNTKNVVQAEQLIRLAPMLAPTFGRVVGKQYHQFVDCDDIWPAFSAFMAQKSFNGSEATYVPQCVPRVPLCLLSLYALTGAKLSIYSSASSGGSDGDSNLNVTLYNESRLLGDNSNATAIYNAFVSKFTFQTNFAMSQNMTGAGRYWYKPFTGSSFNAFELLSSNIQSWLSSLSSYTPQTNVGLFLPLGNPDKESFFHVIDAQSTAIIDERNGVAGYDFEYVPLDSADIVQPVWMSFEGQAAPTLYYFAFRLSSYGKRLRKVLLGLGYQLDLNTESMVSVLPLMAYFKAYYDLFGITQLQNYQDSWCSRFTALITSKNEADLAKYFYISTSDVSNGRRLWRTFGSLICSLADCWYTDTTDYISAHQPKTSYAASASGVTDGFLSIGNNGSNIDLGGYNASGANPDQSASITANPFTALDVDLLKRLYRWSNVQSVAGKQIAAALRAQGFDSFVDECKSNFIGYDEQYVNISDVVSTADTFKDGSGSILGEYGGKGIAYGQTKTFVFETDKFGYWIAFMTIVPKSGYSQGLDQTLIDTEKFDFYNPEFDNLGYKLSEKSVVVGNDDFAAFSESYRSDSFGVIPQYFEWKVAKNISNGDFSLRGTKNTYLPYCLDKEIPVGERQVIKSGETTGINGNIRFDLYKLFPVDSLPSAGEVWRYVARYPWIGTFDRIFANFDSDSLYQRLKSMITGDPSYLDYIVNSYDNFLIHCIVNFQSYAPMLPTEDTFGTDDDGSFDKSIEKA